MKNSKETDIQKSIIDYLSLKGHFVFRCNIQGVPLHQGNKVIGFRPSPMRGVSDILGILGKGVLGWPKGTFLAIEVKRLGRITSQEQTNFLIEVLKKGGCAFIAYSLDDVIEMGF